MNIKRILKKYKTYKITGYGLNIKLNKVQSSNNAYETAKKKKICKIATNCNKRKQMKLKRTKIEIKRNSK